MDKNLKTILMSLVICCLSFASVYACTNEESFGKLEDIEEITPTFSKDDIIKKVLNGEDVPFTNYTLASDYFYLKSKNKDTIGLLAVDNCCYLPIMYTGDNTTYLRHNFYHNYDIYGVPFQNALSDGTFNNISYIHGHNDLNGTRFGNLNQYLYVDFFQNNNPIEIFDGEYLYYYMPFTIFKRADGGNDVLQGDLPKEQKIEYLNKRKSESMFQMKNENLFNPENPVVFLSWCAGYNTIYRYDLGLTMIKKVKYDASNITEIIQDDHQLNNIFKEDKK